MKNKHYDGLIDKLIKLNLQHEREIIETTNMHRAERERLLALIAGEAEGDHNDPDTGERTLRQPWDKFKDREGTPLAIGDAVRLLTEGRTGKYGDKATVVKFGHKLVIVRVASGITTTRNCKNLKLSK
jgi:hypothetical protein